MEIVKLPEELAQIANGVSLEKRNEVQTVLNQVFQGVSKMRTQLDSVVVSDENDKMNMKLANTIRLGVREVRLNAEKTFDAKRSEVQQQMLSFKTEDSLWLKAKQTMQILTKEIEETAKWKEETKARFDAEQKELKIQQRINKISKFSDIGRQEFENMSDETFEMFLTGIEKQYNDKIEAEKKAELDRIEKEKAEIAERERIRLENEKLKKEAEERKIRDSKRNEELRPYIVFIRDYSKMLNISDSEYQKELSEIKKGAEDHWNFEIEERKKEALKQEEEQKKIQAEREAARMAQEKANKEKAGLEAKIQAQKDAEAKALKEKQDAELKAKKEAEKLAKAPVKKQLTNWVNLFEVPPQSPVHHEKVTLILQKFEAFKDWAKKEIESL